MQYLVWQTFFPTSVFLFTPACPRHPVQQNFWQWPIHVSSEEIFSSLFKAKVDMDVWILCNNLGWVTSHYNLGSAMFSAAAFLAPQAKALHQWHRSFSFCPPTHIIAWLQNNMNRNKMNQVLQSHRSSSNHALILYLPSSLLEKITRSEVSIMWIRTLAV